MSRLLWSALNKLTLSSAAWEPKLPPRCKGNRSKEVGQSSGGKWGF
jgi:hypothetical protein